MQSNIEFLCERMNFDPKSIVSIHPASQNYRKVVFKLYKNHPFGSYYVTYFLSTDESNREYRQSEESLNAYFNTKKEIDGLLVDMQRLNDVKNIIAKHCYEDAKENIQYKIDRKIELMKANEPVFYMCKNDI